MAKTSGDRSKKESQQRRAAKRPPQPGAKNRPGFDLGGAVGDATAGTGIGIGEDAAENRKDRRLPGRKPGNKSLKSRTLRASKKAE